MKEKVAFLYFINFQFSMLLRNHPYTDEFVFLIVKIKVKAEQKPRKEIEAKFWELLIVS